jgi:hypothetical protein
MLVFATQSFTKDRRRDIVLRLWAGTDLERTARGVSTLRLQHGDLPLDPWGHQYELYVVSAGPDGVFGTADDIRSRVAR